LPGDILSGAAQTRALDRGFFTFCFSSGSLAYPGFRQQALEVIAAARAATGIASIEVGWGSGCDVRNEVVSDAEFPCKNTDGTISAAACVTYNSDPVRIWFRRQLNLSNWRSAQCHEGSGGNSGHVAWLHEGYDDIRFVSLGDFGTCMDFGTGVWQVTSRDRDRIWNAFVPDAPSALWLDVSGGWAFVHWSGLRADGGYAHLNGIAANTNARRMAFGWSASPSDPVTWTGEICGAEYGYCNTRFSDGTRGFDAYWRGCLWARAENELTWFVPQVSAPDYWTLAGCW